MCLFASACGRYWLKTFEVFVVSDILLEAIQRIAKLLNVKMKPNRKVKWLSLKLMFLFLYEPGYSIAKLFTSTVITMTFVNANIRRMISLTAISLLWIWTFSRNTSVQGQEQEYRPIGSGKDYRLNFRRLWSSKYNQFSTRNNLTIAKIDMTHHGQSHKQTRKTNSRYRSETNWKKSGCTIRNYGCERNKNKKKKKKIRHCGEFIKKFHLFFFIYVIEPRVRKSGNGGNKSNRAINSMKIKCFNDAFVFQSYFSIFLPSFL